MTEAEKKEVWVAQMNKGERKIPFWRRVFVEIFEKQERQILQGVKNAILPQTIINEALKAMDDTMVIEPLQTMYGEVGTEFATDTYKRLGRVTKAETDEALQQSIWNTEMVKYLETEGATSVTTIINTSNNAARKYLQEILLEATENNLTIQETKALIDKKFPPLWRRMATFRSERIARTEVLSALSRGNWLGARSYAQSIGAVLVKEWLTAMDGRERETHGAANGQKVPMAGKFNVGGSIMTHPRDKSAPADEVINCRCTLVYYPEKRSI